MERHERPSLAVLDVVHDDVPAVASCRRNANTNRWHSTTLHRSDRPLREVAVTPFRRSLVYGLAGWALDSLFVAAHTGRRRPSSLLNIPVYALAQPLFEPVHDRVRRRHVAVRGAAYGVGILGVEYASGRLLRRASGKAPWDYGRARFAVDGLVRLDYLPLWSLFGLGLERLHDVLDP